MKFREIYIAFFASLLLSFILFLPITQATDDCYDLLIIGPENYRPYVDVFISFKHSLGVLSRYVSVEWIKDNFPSSDLVYAIKAFVVNEFERSRIKHLLLVGCYDQVPTKYVYSPCSEEGFADFNYKPSDWFYGVPDWHDSQVGFLGGNIPKIAVGRLPVKNIEELQQTISKIMMVERNPLRGLFLVLHEVNLKSLGGNASEVEGFSTNYFVKELSSGIAYTLTCAHGSPSALWTVTSNGSYVPLFTEKDVKRINGTYNIHYLLSCFSGALDLEGESLARALITSTKGPALVIANSRTELLDNPIPSTFWERFFQTGDVAGSLLYAITTYLNNPEFFNINYPSFKRYNLYLCQVVYGDVSWKIESPEKALTSHQPMVFNQSKNQAFQINCESSCGLSLLELCAACLYVLPVGACLLLIIKNRKGVQVFITRCTFLAMRVDAEKNIAASMIKNMTAQLVKSMSSIGFIP